MTECNHFKSNIAIGNAGFHCINCGMDWDEAMKELAELDNELELDRDKSHHPYKVEPNVQEQIKHLNRRIGVLESRLGSKRSEVKELSTRYERIKVVTWEEHYQKTLERIKHDLKIGGGDDT